MRHAWHLLGRLAFWLSWPLLYVYLYRTSRTRVLVVYGDEVLVVKGWHGSGRWGLPGGGLHHGEEPANGAVRELKEETTIEVNATELQLLFENNAKRQHRLRYKVFAYVLQLKSKPKLKKQRLEITHLEWIQWRELYEDPKTDGMIKDMLAYWFRP